VVHDVFRGLLANGFIEKRAMTAPFDPQAARFLPDRYVEGTCPNCGFEDARGDQCDECGRTLDPQELKNPRSKLTGATPEYRETDHYFLLLSKLEDDLKAWVTRQADAGKWRSTVRNFTENWLQEGLKDRAITRDLTYGVPIPEDVEAHPDKRIYVWFEAVIGYRSAPVEWAASQGDADAWKPFWLAPNDPEHYYFLGKDNIPFHTIIWPAMLIGYNKNRSPEEQLALPTDVPANEFLQFAGAKFSKSRGNVFYVLDLAKHFDVDAVRYYMTINMPERGDTDWTWPDFVAKVNDELVASLGNYVNRVLSFCNKHWGGVPDVNPADFDLASIQPGWVDAEKEIEGGDGEPGRVKACGDALAARQFKQALRHAMHVARVGNQRLNDLAPWTLVKQGEEGKAKAAAGLQWHLSVIKTLSIITQPFMPALSESIWRQLGETGESPRALAERMHPGEDAWPTRLTPVTPGQRFGDVKPLVKKLDPEWVKSEFQDEEQEEKKVSELPSPSPGAPAVTEEKGSAFKPTIEFDDFMKLDLRVGVVKSVEDHPKADKLYVLKVDLGVEERQILAGLRGLVPPEDLQGKHVIVIANLAPRKIRGLESQGMLLAAENGDDVTPLTPLKDLPAGSEIR
jgi:methionyl-tRNA synthetase